MIILCDGICILQIKSFPLLFWRSISIHLSFQIISGHIYFQKLQTKQHHEHDGGIEEAIEDDLVVTIKIDGEYTINFIKVRYL